MKNLIANIKSDRSLLIGIIYVIFICSLAGIVNYYNKELADLGWISTPLPYAVWTLLYLPLVYFTIKRKWRIKDFGFKLNVESIILSIIIIVFFVFFKTETIKNNLSFTKIISEAFARTGEEVFFRGFVYLLIIKLFSDKKHISVWAIILSSIIFTVVHTQPGREFVGLSLFISVVGLLAIPRWLTNSILPCVVIHLLMNSSLITALIGIMIFLIIIFIGLIRGENVIESTSISKKVNEYSK